MVCWPQWFLFAFKLQGPKARQMIAQGKRDEVRAALGKLSTKFSPSPPRTRRGPGEESNASLIVAGFSARFVQAAMFVLFTASTWTRHVPWIFHLRTHRRNVWIFLHVFLTLLGLSEDSQFFL